ncbi:phenylalanine--tRNA ligase subunit beta [Pseudoalteromonas luteoviolacea]|uniref:Phenylalanine--tRNA ligase beta subunit n=1 Tax=Pseudoalteromonas luteoviolacea S4054 TaxID=1129367 RepID=A0A0F6A698_9GAMM|nr:phenylalanine--tRNA ligase subunit beta [Pseudoalteromonas luteoviolacea]AOT07610.1 phenylalanine--tRNA ligase subunit beta [Pseudoalteromonas luteoviolacea]AOT12526.1 phenylalanine--tRNA ligase subunit beta [Pseudoalteromonas luteoviolacea]AOT17440.1 phenylalanine--tRNA ligase subunit beta [Pseudoalteromonas luteoviolacea]KKE81351.1 phenylalanyl-tRNA synthetase [Pseudoalteromonas luteoviolacea S4054]KZN70640.1 phenylalanyl-tRNA synthetase [Pseudoalteromonas luteoviolacea S4047-1]
MKFSEKWLREWVNPAIDTDALSEQLSMAGLEVDGVDPVAGDFDGVVIGEVVECGQHPDADKLRVTKVNVGEEELLDIVCGAANCRAGLKVAVAKVGAVLPGGFKIKKAKLRGQPSHGMLCAFEELGMAESSDGILELSADATIGQNIREYFALDDVTIDVDLTANRSDCLGIKGLAREVGVLNGIDVTEVAINAVEPTIDDKIEIELVDSDACPRYLGRVIKGINLDAESPLWLVEKLRRSGIRSIDPVVDVTNYVLLELGHPMHAFDLASISGGIKVRKAQQDEELVLLDGNTAKLNTSTLLIADHEKALAMAGIFGGEASGVKEGTQDILLESAFFNPLAIAGQARSYGLHTDASHRYERGVDHQLQRDAMERATALLLDIVGGEAGPVVEAVSDADLPAAKSVTLRRERLDRVIGYHIEDAKVTDILTRLGLEVSVEAGQWQAQVPSYRFDISIEEDLIEEVARVFGYNNIPNVAPTAALKMTDHQEASVPVSRFRNELVARGYQEAITYSFVDPKKQALLHPQSDALVLPHPISVEMSAMRVSLMPGLVNALVYNQNRQQSRIRFFEHGLKFIKDENAENGVRQSAVIGGIVYGNTHNEHWGIETRKADFFDIKGDVEALLAVCNDPARFSFKAEASDGLHPGQSAAIYADGVKVGFIGAIHPQLQKSLELNDTAFVFEVEVNAISQRKLPEAVNISKFPSNRRDIAILVADDVKIGDILESIEKVGGNQLVDLNLFDVYKGKGIEPDYKSLAIALTLQNVDKTLEEKDINEVVDRVVAELAKQFNASLRD